MIAAWLFYAAFVAAAAGTAALALERAARTLGRPTRLPWLAALTFSTVWPIWALAHSALSSDGMAAGAVRLPPVLITVGRDALDAFARHFPVVSNRVSAALLVTWLVVTSILLARLLVGMLLIHRQRQSWTAREVDGVPVLLTLATGPAVVGLRRPTIVLPGWALALEPELRQIVLSHELEHVHAGDTVLRLVGAVITALMPWNLALWWQADRLALAIEMDCDARVLRTNGGRQRYGLLLLAIAQHQSTVMLAPALSEPTSHLERRITAMQHSTPRRPLLVAACLTAAATISIVLACSAPEPDAVISPAPERGVAPRPNSPYVEFTLSKRAMPAAGNKAPSYPTALRAAGMEGEVLVQFVVDQQGNVENSTFKVVKSTNPAFTAAVREVLPAWRYRPAEVSGRRVKQLVQEPFAFRLAL